jgi:P pilus assembly chaperone PapD
LFYIAFEKRRKRVMVSPMSALLLAFAALWASALAAFLVAAWRAPVVADDSRRTVAVD